MEYCCSVAQSLSHFQLLTTPWTAAHRAFLSITISQNLFKLMSIESVMSSNHLILCHSLFRLPSIFLSIRVFSKKSDLWIRKPKYWGLSFSIRPSNEYTGFISYRIDWFALLAFQGTLKSLLQHHISKTSIIWCSAFFMVQVSHSYMTTRKNISKTLWTFVCKVMCLLFNMLSRLVIDFLPGNKHLFISWVKSPSSVVSEPKKIKSVIVSIVSPPISMKWWDQMPWS